MKILVRCANWIGDHVLSYPFFFYLRRAYPQAWIAAVAPAWVSDLQYENLVNEVILEDRRTESWLTRLQGLESAAAGIRQRGPWDMGFSLPNSLAAAWLLWRSNVRRRIGYQADARGLMLNQGRFFDPNPYKHRAQAYVELLPRELRPKIDARGFWQDPQTPVFDPRRAWPRIEEPLSPPESAYWVLAPSTKASSRRWPIESFVGLARLVWQQTGWRGLIVGSQEDGHLARALLEYSGTGLEDWTGRGPASALWRVLRGAAFTVANDSGLAHLAALCGSPLHFICGAGDPRRTTPIGPNKIQMSVNQVPCWPCEKNVCRLPEPQYLQCLKGIEPSQVWKQIQTGLLSICS